MAEAPTFDPRVVDALYLCVAAIVASLSEAQRAGAHKLCDVCLSDPDLLRRFGAADPDSEASMRGIVDQMFTGFAPRL